jgi:hypothetical protein
LTAHNTAGASGEVFLNATLKLLTDAGFAIANVIRSKILWQPTQSWP